MEVESEQELGRELQEFINQLIVPLLVERLLAETSDLYQRRSLVPLMKRRRHRGTTSDTACSIIHNRPSIPFNNNTAFSHRAVRSA